MMPVHMSMWESDRDHFISDGSVYAMLRYVYTHRDTKPCLQACHYDSVINDSCSCWTPTFQMSYFKKAIIINSVYNPMCNSCE
jgi:hypothetical protein